MKDTYRLFCSQQDTSKSGADARPLCYQQHVQQVLKRYPHRESQIQQLLALLDASASMSSAVSDNQVHIPAPIFCVGPESTGKTQIVCDVVEVLKAKQQNRTTNDAVSSTNRQPSMKAAYVDCSIVEPSLIERLVHSVYRQLQPAHSIRQSTRKKNSRTKRIKKRRRISPENNSTQHFTGEASEGAIEKDDDMTRRILPSRHAKIVSETANGGTRAIQTPPHPQGSPSTEKVESSNSAVVSLGRSLQQYYGTEHTTRRAGRHSAILILDKAEELVTLSSADKKSSRRRLQKSLSRSSAQTSSSTKATNFLAELLLMPKVMKLDLTVVVITNYALLDKTKLNNSLSASKSLATISNGIHPIVIQFPAYLGNHMFCDILSTPANQRLVMGDSFCKMPRCGSSSMSDSLRSKFVSSFWNTVVQFASDTTRDIRDFIRIGRALWPEYVAPIEGEQVRDTMEKVAQRLGISIENKHALLAHTESLGKELVRFLGTRFHTHVATLSKTNESSLLAWNVNASLPSDADDLVSMSFRRCCLLLAAFICQNNKASHDQKVFSIRGNGQRRKSHAMEDLYGGNEEDLAFGTASKSRAFVLERVYSIFVTLVRLNPTADDEGDLDHFMDSLGSTRLHKDLCHLVDLGHLRSATHNGLLKGEQINLSTARFTCSLSQDEANYIAKKHCIPLEQYLV
jgi:Cdc6-like AAA superfamily ATPase